MATLVDIRSLLYAFSGLHILYYEAPGKSHI